MGLDDVLQFLKDSHHLQRPPDYRKGDLAIVYGSFIRGIQTTTYSLDHRLMDSANTDDRERKLEQTLTMLEKNLGLKRALREIGHRSMPAELKMVSLALLTGIHTDPYVGSVNREAVALGIVRETGLVWKESGKNVVGIVAVKSTAGPHLHGAILLETGLVQFGSYFPVPGDYVFSCDGFIVPPGVPVGTSPDGGIPPDEYIISCASFSLNSRNKSISDIAQAFGHAPKVNREFFEPVFSKTLLAARQLGADEKLIVEASEGMSRSAEYAVMLANAYMQLQPAR